MAATVVKSKYVVDPNDKLNLIKRDDEDSLALDRQYWERVNQGETVRGAAKMFERSNSEEERREPVRVGKLRSRAGFLESLEAEEEVVYRDQVKTGKLNMDSLFCGAEEETARPQVKVGKLRPEVGMFTGIVEAVPAVVKPRMQIGKLDPKNMFDNNTEDKENETDKRSSIVIGKINARNLFENNFEDSSINKSHIPVGKINTKDIFPEVSDTAKSTAKIDIKVGKLKIKEEELFESKDDLADKTVVRVGKLNASDLFTSSPTEEKVEAVKFYKPTVQPKKLKVAELFAPEKENSAEISPRGEVRVGRLNTSKLFSPPEQQVEKEGREEIRVGKLDTSKLFSPSEQEEREERLTVGKLRLGGVWEEPKEDEPRREVVRVGKLRQNIYEAKEETKDDLRPEQEEVKVGKVRSMFSEAEGEKEAAAPVVLRGARRVNKGNRISCLIENLHTDKKPEEGEEDTEPEKEEDVTISKERMSRIQSMFSGEKREEEGAPLAVSPTCSDFTELQDEGLVAANLQRFTTGNLRRTSQGEGRRESLDTSYIDRKHIESVASKFEASSSQEEREPLERGRPRRVRQTDQVFQHSKEDYTDCVRTEVRVGKLSKDVFNPAPESPKEEKQDMKVGKLSTKDLFAQAEENSEELLREVRVGKLTQDRLTMASSTDLDKLERTDADTSIAPTGGVLEKLSAFTAAKKESSSPKLSCPKIKRSESSAADDMQRKYEQQMASTALKRGNSSAALVVRRENRAAQVVKVEPVAKRASLEPELTVDEMLRASQPPRVEAGKMQEARSSFFSSMIAASSAPSSVQRLGTSIVPQVSAEDREKFEEVEREKQRGGGRSRGKALFQRMAEKEKEEKEEGEEKEEEEVRLLPVELLPGVDMDEMRMTVLMRRPAELIPGVDLEEIEDEFEALHRQMMEEGPPL